jgi:hypothetical protein
VNQLNIGRQNILQAKAIDGVGVASTDFHDAVMLPSIGNAMNLLGGPGNEFWISEFVYISHVEPSTRIDSV